MALPASAAEFTLGYFMKILLVEDDVILASTMECILSEAGHEVVGLAREEQLAIRTAARTRPDLALVDFELARGPSGGEVARKLRENFEIPAVFVSGSPGDCHKVGIHVGVIGCLVKPFTPTELVGTVDAMAAILRQKDPDTVPSNLHLYCR